VSSFAPQRPSGVVVVAMLEIIAGIFSISVSLLLETGKATGLVNPKLIADVGAFGAIIAILGVFAFVMSYGIWMRKRWAWTYSVMVAALSILTNITAFFFGSTISVLDAGMQALVIYYLSRSSVKAFFPKLYQNPN
jgi:uncharacterized membrane protein (DUF2068 family)